MSKLPKGWVETTIDSLFVRLEDGRTLGQGWSPQCENEPSLSDEKWGVLRTTAIQAGAFLPEHNKLLPRHLEPRHLIEVKAGDLLVTCAGPRARCGVACLVRDTRPRLMISGKMYRFRVPEELVDPRYVEAFLQTAQAWSDIDAMKTGGSDNGLNLTHDRFRQLIVRLAPFREQRVIVNEIEKHFTRLDAATAALKRVQANLKRYRASVLKNACESRLVPTEAELARKEGREYEPADKLLQRILRERRAHWETNTLAKMQASGKPPKDDRWKQKYKEPSRPDLSNHPPLADGWICVSLDTVAEVIDPNPSHRTPKYVEHGVAFVSAENFVGDRSVDFRIGRQVGHEFLKEQIERFQILPGAFAMSRYGTIGKTCKLPPERTYCLSYSLVVIQSISSRVDSEFLRLVCSSGMILALAQSRIQGAAIPDLGVANIRSLPIAIPPLEEQVRINDEAARKLSVVDQMSESIRHQMLHANRLRQSVLATAFTGQLVLQDPTDEPASVLLERIRDELSSSDLQRPARRSRKEPAHA